MWWRLALVVALGFAVQENLEHLLTHGHAPGLGVLAGPEYPLALPIIGLVTAATAVVAALVSRTQQVVEAIEAVGGAIARHERCLTLRSGSSPSLARSSPREGPDEPLLPWLLSPPERVPVQQGRAWNTSREEP